MRITMMLMVWLGIFIATAMAQDIQGSQDHPIISRYPESVIRWYNIENYRPYRIPTGKVTGYRQVSEGIDTEGRVTRIYYSLDGGKRSDSEVYKNYRDALANAGFDILAEGFEPAGKRSIDVGGVKWREVLFLSNPWNDTSAAVNEMARGSATSGGGGSIVARKERAAGTAYVVVSVYQFRADRISTLIDVIEVAAAELGKVVVNAEAIGAGIVENGRVVLDGVFFDFDKATIKPESKVALEQISQYLQAQPQKTFYVVGHTDSKGTFAYNLKLSADRAYAVREALVKDFGIKSDRLQSHGVASLVPVFANSSEAGRERNRRVELVEQ